MKDILSDWFLGIILIIIVITGGFFAFKSFMPQGPAASKETDSGEHLEAGQYASKESELTIKIPAEFKVAVARGINTEDPNIFVATSSEDLMTIRKTSAEDESLSEQEIMDGIYESLVPIKEDEVGQSVIMWSNVGRGMIGENNFIFRDGIRKYQADGQDVVEAVKQYITYGAGEVFFIDFITFYQAKPVLWDGIVASIRFKK
jgi:predicted Fe-Mo cluster-binding NifX family protein